MTGGRFGDFVGAVGVAGEFPAAFVAEDVVVATEQADVRCFGVAAVFPPDEMMGIAPFGGSFAAGECTAAVADHDGFADRGGDEAGGAAEVEDFGRRRA